MNIHTLILGDSSKPSMVLVHGFGGSGALFYKVFNEVCRHFRFILIDVIGMGSSSRPQDFDRFRFNE